MKTKVLTNLEWLAGFTANQIYISCGEHHSDYRTAEEALNLNYPRHSGIATDLREEMIATDSIWELVIYPDTPIGSYRWWGPSFDSVLGQAREHFRLLEWRQRLAELNENPDALP